MAELELPYRDHHVHLIETGSYENVGRDYLAVNPAGLLPVLVHKGAGKRARSVSGTRRYLIATISISKTRVFPARG